MLEGNLQKLHVEMSNEDIKVEGAARLFLAGSGKKALRDLEEIKEKVRLISETSDKQRPVFAKLLDDVQRFSSITEELEPKVNDLRQSSAGVNELVNNLSDCWKEHSTLQEQKWRAHETEAQLKTEQISTELKACLRTKDLAEERQRVDGHVTASMKSMSLDQMRKLQQIMSGELEKIVGHVAGIKASFDAAIAVVQSRVDNIKSEFSLHRDDLIKEKEEKGHLFKHIQEAKNRQKRLEASLENLKRTSSDANVRHTTDISILQQVRSNLDIGIMPTFFVFLSKY